MALMYPSLRHNHQSGLLRSRFDLLTADSLLCKKPEKSLPDHKSGRSYILALRQTINLTDCVKDAEILVTEMTGSHSFCIHP